MSWNMDMALRSFVLAAALALFAAAGLLAWSVFDGGIRFSFGSDEPDLGETITVGGGSLYDEFGESGSAYSSGAGGTITVGSSPARASFGSGPRFDWSGSPSRGDAFDLPRGTPAERVEADCRMRGGTSYGCRCLVRLARQDLSEAEFEFLSLVEEAEPRAERLAAAGLETPALTAFSAKLVALDVTARRRCGAGLAY